jgi:hypothetical protein
MSLDQVCSRACALLHDRGWSSVRSGTITGQRFMTHSAFKRSNESCCDAGCRYFRELSVDELPGNTTTERLAICLCLCECMDMRAQYDHCPISTRFSSRYRVPCLHVYGPVFELAVHVSANASSRAGTWLRRSASRRTSRTSTVPLARMMS